MWKEGASGGEIGGGKCKRSVNSLYVKGKCLRNVIVSESREGKSVVNGNGNTVGEFTRGVSLENIKAGDFKSTVVCQSMAVDENDVGVKLSII